MVVAGESCEFRATDNCNNPADPDPSFPVPDLEDKMETSALPFCVNNGKCVLDPADNLYYCECSQDEWTGRRCENRASSPQASPAPTVMGTDTWPPTIEASITPYPSEASPSPSPIVATEPDRSPDASQLSNSNEDDGMSGFGKFAVTLVSFAVVFTGAIAIYRYYTRSRFGKELESANANNLQLDMISEENNADGMTSVNLDTPKKLSPTSVAEDTINSTDNMDSKEGETSDRNIV